MPKDVEEYSINELAVGAIKQLRRIADGIEAQNKMHQAFYDLTKDQTKSDEPKTGERLEISHEKDGGGEVEEGEGNNTPEVQPAEKVPSSTVSKKPGGKK